ncbi:PadR family transcriptional regulator [Ktedonosporobacter rubrisoli]|uniref:PadR family transcriptional regulator n=1 Tax=Ktedonosporobacter rubrisoli TaxID=2509675 RepID=A0A4P6K4Q1_KTERU|nr:PadR family transcriptional regulator [Ktedonosporobacter rubrisoli]QBD83045.1 PadR family transcriptional regulator [Ktedonosporobacter rubrisoli]
MPGYNRRFNNQFGGDWEGWTPPWLHRDWPRRGARFGERIMRGFFGPEGPGEGNRFFRRGDVKYALLELLQERPMHGYEMMKALEEKSGGFYTPSAGSIYPTLQMLEDRGLVTAEETEGKKVYSITDAGRELLTQKQQEEQEFRGPWEQWFESGQRWNTPEMQALRSEAFEVARLFAIAGRKAYHNPEELPQLREVLEKARKELSNIIYNTRENTSEEAKTE